VDRETYMTAGFLLKKKKEKKTYMQAHYSMHMYIKRRMINKN